MLFIVSITLQDKGHIGTSYLVLFYIMEFNACIIAELMEGRQWAGGYQDKLIRRMC